MMNLRLKFRDFYYDVSHFETMDDVGQSYVKCGTSLRCKGLKKAEIAQSYVEDSQ